MADECKIQAGDTGRADQTDIEGENHGCQPRSIRVISPCYCLSFGVLNLYYSAASPSLLGVEKTGATSPPPPPSPQKMFSQVCPKGARVCASFDLFIRTFQKIEHRVQYYFSLF
jgi:hypothetical protein